MSCDMDFNPIKVNAMQKLNKELNNVRQETNNSKRLIRIREVIQLTGISKSYIYQLVNQNLFPKSIQLVPGGTSVAWVESEVHDWIDTRIEFRDAEEKAQALVHQ